MVITELVIILETIKKEQGDIEVSVHDADTGWVFKIKSTDIVSCSDSYGERVEIVPNYESDMIVGQAR